MKRFGRISVMLASAAALAALLGETAFAQGSANIGKHPSISILVNSSPWYAGFEMEAQAGLSSLSRPRRRNLHQ
jgi:hypothetical protein